MVCDLHILQFETDYNEVALEFCEIQRIETDIKFVLTIYIAILHRQTR